MAFDAETSKEVTAKDRLIRVRDKIAGLGPEHFDMSYWVCGTSACIGGWTARMFMGEANPDSYDTFVVGELLGLTEDASEDLFFMDSSDRSFSAVTKEVAVKVLDHLIATGEVDWEKGFED